MQSDEKTWKPKVYDTRNAADQKKKMETQREIRFAQQSN